MAKIKSFSDGRYLGFHCPGCKYDHAFTDGSWKGDPAHKNHWDFNGDFDRPTFRPSLLVWASDPSKRCHSFVTDGQIQFLDDCFHELKGQTVEIPDYETT